MSFLQIAVTGVGVVSPAGRGLKVHVDALRVVEHFAGSEGTGLHVFQLLYG